MLLGGCLPFGYLEPQGYGQTELRALAAPLPRSRFGCRGGAVKGVPFPTEGTKLAGGPRPVAQIFRYIVSQISPKYCTDPCLEP